MMKEIQYQTFEVSQQLKSQNALGVVLGSGWHRGYLAWSNNKNSYGDDVSFIAQLMIEYEDGTKERKQYPAEIWRLNDDEVTKVFPSSKVISKITVDPDEETADVDLSNNSWPKTTETKFDNFKRNQIKG